MKSFFFTMVAGLLGLTATAVFPALRIDWLALVMAAAVLRGGLVSAWLGLVALSCLYSVCSAASPLEIALPFAAGIGIFYWLRKSFAMGFWPAKGFLISTFCLNAWLLRTLGTRAAGLPFSIEFGDAASAALTLAVGMAGIPVLQILARASWGRVVQWRSSKARLSPRSPWLKPPAPRFSRKPFGLEKGL